MTKIYRECLVFFIASLPTLLVLAILVEGARCFLPYHLGLTFAFATKSILAYFFHRHFLFGEPLNFTRRQQDAAAPPIKMGWFVVTSLALLSVPALMALNLAALITGLPLGDLTEYPSWPIDLLALSLFGFVFPALVARDGTYHLWQGTQVGFQTLLRLTAAPGVVSLVLFGLAMVSDQSLATVPDESLLLLAFYVLLTTMEFMITILVVAVLCEMYRNSRPDPHHG